MSKQFTLILIAPAHIARVDLSYSRKAKLKAAWTRERIASEPLAGQVDAALRLGPTKSGEVWVLPCDTWTGVVSLERDLAGMLEGDELQQSIALEAEAFSGISAFESRLGTRKLPPDINGDARWWVTQVPHVDWQESQRCVRQWGGKWGGMAHPASVFHADPTAPSSDDTCWKIIQSFGDTTVAFTGLGERIVDILVAGNLSTQRTVNQLADWRSSHAIEGETVTWVTDAGLPARLIDETDVTCRWLSDGSRGEQALEAWAKALAEQLSLAPEDETRLPVLAAEKPPMSNRAAMLAACSMAAAALLVCFGLHTLTSEKLASVTAEVDKLDQQNKKLAGDKKALTELEKQAQTLRSEVDALQTRNETLQQELVTATQMRRFQQTRWLQMISSLASCTSPDCWVREIRSDQQSVHVAGIAIGNRDVASFASHLESTVAEHGWAAHPAQTEHNEIGLIEFNVTLDIRETLIAEPHIETASKTNSPTELVSTQP